MSLTATSVFADRPDLSAIPCDAQMDCQSPFGLQGLAKDMVHILRPGCINRLAVDLALRGTPEQIQDLDFVNRVLSFHPDWMEEYRIVHLIERSLWIQGHSDLVMTMTRNPAQIPDNPPQKIRDALTRAIAFHPDATIWYGVPLFGSEKNPEGLPIPVTASEVRIEAENRISAAQTQALRWRWLYRTALGIARIPATCWQLARAAFGRVQYSIGRIADYWKKAREDARFRARATIMARLEHCRYGRSLTAIPEHRTALGRGLDSASLVIELLAYHSSYAKIMIPFMANATIPLAVASYMPMMFLPLTVISIDPFLFVELPDEPGRLRHIGHWYWQTQAWGEKTLHLHV